MHPIKKPIFEKVTHLSYKKNEKAFHTSATENHLLIFSVSALHVKGTIH